MSAPDPRALACPSKIPLALEGPSTQAVLTVTVTVDNSGPPHYATSRPEAPVVAPKRLGLMLADAPKLERGLAMQYASQSDFEEARKRPWGEHRLVRNRYLELRVRFVESAAPARTLWRDLPGQR